MSQTGEFSFSTWPQTSCLQISVLHLNGKVESPVSKCFRCAAMEILPGVAKENQTSHR